jgi:hypothetical protein
MYSDEGRPGNVLVVDGHPMNRSKCDKEPLREAAPRFGGRGK